MQALTDTKQRMPSSRVLEDVIRQAPGDYVTIGWLTSILHRHSFGIIILCLGLLSTTPIGSTIPGLILAIMAVQLIMGRGEPVFPDFIMKRRLPTKQLSNLVSTLFIVPSHLLPVRGGGIRPDDSCGCRQSRRR
jgi:hypothetical protein